LLIAYTYARRYDCVVQAQLGKFAFMFIASGVIVSCAPRSNLWEDELAGIEKKIDTQVASGPGSVSGAQPATDSPNSMVSRLSKLGNQSDQEQAKAIERGIERAVQQQAAMTAQKNKTLDAQFSSIASTANAPATRADGDANILVADKSAATQNKDATDPAALAAATRNQNATDSAPNAIAAPGAEGAGAQQTGFGVERVWGLAELAATALEANPATRESWQRARAAAAREQKALAAYGPNIGVEAGGDYFQEPGLAFGYGSNAPPDREFRFTPQVYASWLLLDFGRRDADTDRARAELASANMSHDRTIQRVVVEVQRAYFKLESALGLRTAAEQDVVAARSVLKATEAKLKLGLATRPDTLIARQAFAQTLYKLEKRRADVFVAEGDLRTRTGFPATVAIPIDMAAESDLPPMLTMGIDGIIDQALASRPDLASAVLDLRAREAEVRRAQAEYLPEVVTRGTAGYGLLNYEVTGFGIQGQGWGFDGQIFLGGKWLLYDNGARDAALFEAGANRAASAARLAQSRLNAADEVWRAYYTLQSDRAQYDAAKALLVSAIDTFDAVKRAYELGLSTLPELLDAEHDLFQARSLRIETRSDLLCSSANLIYASGAGPGSVTGER
jgi:outer membrane protein